MRNHVVPFLYFVYKFLLVTKFVDANQVSSSCHAECKIEVKPQVVECRSASSNVDTKNTSETHQGETKADNSDEFAPDEEWFVHKIWPLNTLLYEFDESLKTCHKSMIRRAMAQLASQTCVLFERYDVNKHPFENRVIFRNVDEKPENPQGYQEEVKERYLDLVEDNYRRIGYLHHELLRTLGMWYQNNRFDRDDYISVDLSLVAQGSENFYEIYKSSKPHSGYYLPYDYYSVMHLPRDAYQNGGNPMKAKGAEDGKEPCLGQRVKASECDLELLRIMYQCPYKYINKCTEQKEADVFPQGDSCASLYR